VGIQEKVSDNQQGFRPRDSAGDSTTHSNAGDSVSNSASWISSQRCSQWGVSHSEAAVSTGRPLFCNLGGQSAGTAGWGSAELHTAQQERRPRSDSLGVSPTIAAPRVQLGSAQAGGQLPRGGISEVSRAMTPHSTAGQRAAGQRRDSTTNSTAQRQQDSTAQQAAPRQQQHQHRTATAGQQ
jgi:hypothetical protein